MAKEEDYGIARCGGCGEFFSTSSNRKPLASSTTPLNAIDYAILNHAGIDVEQLPVSTTCCYPCYKEIFYR